MKETKGRVYWELDANKNMKFRTHLDVLAECFGIFYQSHQRATWRLPKNEEWMIWFPHETTKESKKKDIEWFNSISEDGMNIYERSKNGNEYLQDSPYMKDCIRLVFMEIPSVGEYVFKGVYVGNLAKMEVGDHTFTRIATKVRLIGDPVYAIELLDEDRSGMKDSCIIDPLDETHSDEEREEHAKTMDIYSLKAAAEKHTKKKPVEKVVETKQIVRDPYIAQYAKKRANGICQLCEQKAPFFDKKGEPYLESHHIIWLSAGGTDSIENTVALCPNCHRKMHIVADEEAVEALLKKSANEV